MDWQKKLNNNSQQVDSQATNHSQVNNQKQSNSQSPNTKNKQYFFMRSSSVDSQQQKIPYQATLPKRSNTQVNEMKNLFEF